MDKTLKVTFIVGLFVSLVFLYGFRTVSRAIKSCNQVVSISTGGSAEKTVKSDIAEINIVIKNKDEDFAKLYDKRMADQKQVLDFLKTCGLDEKDVISITAKTENRGEREGNWGVVKISHKEQAFASEDTVLVRTKNFEAVDKIKNDILQLASKGLIVSYDYKYKLLNLEEIRSELLTLAAKDAEKKAKILLAPFGKQVKKLISINEHSDMTIMNETDNYRWESYDSKNMESLMKKVRQEVSASFSYE